MPLGIHKIAHSVPVNRLDNETLIRRYGFEEAFLDQKLGIKERRTADDTETAATLSTEAIRKVLADSGVDGSDLDLMIIVTQTPDYCLPHTSALVHGVLGLPKNLPVFDISLGCSGFVYGLSLVSAFLDANNGDRGLLVTADTYSKIMDPDDKTTVSIFGDGAAATLITRDGIYIPGKFTFGSDGSRHEALIVPGSGSRKPEDKANLSMDGRAIFNFMMSEIPDDIDRCLEANELGKDDIDFWVFHQASKFMLETLGKEIGIPPEKIIIDLADIGNTTSSTIPIALERQVLSRDPLSKRVFICGFGVGLSWASTVLYLQQEKP